MKNLIDLEAFKLDKVQMNEVVGGITREQYCKDIQVEATYAHENQTWDEAQWDSWADAYEKNCMRKN